MIAKAKLREFGNLVKSKHNHNPDETVWTLFLPNDHNDSNGIVTGRGNDDQEALDDVWKELSDLVYLHLQLAEGDDNYEIPTNAGLV